MIVEITIPSPGESITEVEIANWLVADGDIVEKDQEIAEVESDKATLPLIAEKSGKIKILVETGRSIKVGAVACTVDTSFATETEQQKPSMAKVQTKEVRASEKAPVIAISSKPEIVSDNKVIKENQKTDKNKDLKITPLARNMMDANNLNVDDILKGLKKISTREVRAVLDSDKVSTSGIINGNTSREVKRERMSSLRRKMSQRLVAARNETAMLTTFNEADMSHVIDLRKKYQDQFVRKHGVKLGFMSFFTKTVTESLVIYPRINSQIDGEEIIVPAYTDIAIAVQTEKGLMVPVLRNAEAMSFAELEKNIAELAGKARSYKLSIEEMTGGTFTITNGGIYGSMLSTPLLNQPQSAILGMHAIIERPVAVKGRIEIRPMMYLALSYDHRLIDGRDSVSFLVKVRELIENPAELLFNGLDPEKILLGIS
jgi:2-oxoglutarate dehydrogenase E2 component (dihydrolipoamide succinyltransferase)